MKNKTLFITGILLALTLLGNFVSAFGTSYIFDRPLKLYPGQTRNIYVTLQNNNDPNPIIAVAEMTQEVKVAKMTDGLDNFVVPYHQPVQVNLSFTAPPDAEVGDMYRVELRFIPQATETGGMGIVFLTGSNIDVLIVEKGVPTEEIAEEADVTGALIFLGLAIIIISVILIVLVKKRIKK